MIAETIVLGIQLVLAANGDGTAVDRRVIFQRTLAESCKRHFRRSNSADTTFCSCFSRSFVTSDNLHAIENADGVMNDGVRARLKNTGAVCLKSSSQSVKGIAMKWIENEK